MIDADTLHAAGRVLEAVRPGVEQGPMSREAGIAFLEHWHEFYLLAGTAAVTLVGLLFVALSFNLDVLIHESRRHMLAHARSTLMTFSYLLVVSLGVLTPAQSPSLLGILVAVASLVFGGVHVVSTRRRHDGDSKFERGMRRRGRIFLIAYVIAFVTSIGMVLTGDARMIFNLIPVVSMMLGTAMGVSWDLLVEVGKLKAAMAAEAAEAVQKPEAAKP